MKTAISVPDELYERVERVARTHGMRRSQFYAAAASSYADELESTDLTEAIDAAVAAVGADESTDFAIGASRAALAAEDDSW